MSNLPSPFGRDDREEERSPEETPRDLDAGRHERHRTDAPWIGGVVLLLMGFVFLLQNLGVSFVVLENWWALFILIPAVSALSRAWGSYRRTGRLDQAVIGSAIGGLAILMVALTFLIDLEWDLIWPTFLILAGIGALISALR